MPARFQAGFAGWTSPDAGATGWNAKATEQLAGYEQASRDRIAGIRADRAEREANADRATFVEERDVTDPEAHSRAATGRVHADPEQSRDEHAGPELGGGDSQQTQADELAAAGDVAAQVEIEGMSEQAQAEVIEQADPAEVGIIEAGSETWDAQAGNLRAAELEGEQMDLQGASIAQQVAELNPAEQVALVQIMGTIDQQQEHGHDLER